MGKGRQFQSWVSDCSDPSKSGRKSTPQILWRACGPSLVSRGGAAGAQGRSASRWWREAGSRQGLVAGSSKDPSLLLAFGAIACPSPVPVHQLPCSGWWGAGRAARVAPSKPPATGCYSCFLILLLPPQICFLQYNLGYGIIEGFAVSRGAPRRARGERNVWL